MRRCSLSCLFTSGCVPLLLLAATPAAAAPMAASQIDHGFYEVEKWSGSLYVLAGFVEVHDFDNGGTTERHEHWYEKSIWDANTAKLRFRYVRSPLGHGNRPPPSSWNTHHGFNVAAGAPDTATSDPSTTPTSCTGADAVHLCPVLYTIADASANVVGYANSWLVSGVENEMYYLDTSAFVPPSPNNCSAVWQLTRWQAPLPDPSPSQPEPKRLKSGTSNWDFRHAIRDAGASGDGGSNTITPGGAPACPP